MYLLKRYLVITTVLLILTHGVGGTPETEMKTAKEVMQAYNNLSAQISQPMFMNSDKTAESLHAVVGVSHVLATVGKVLAYPKDFNETDATQIRD